MALGAAMTGLRPIAEIMYADFFFVAFDQVVNHVCSYRPGALVEVEVERAGERKVYKLKLAVRPTSYGSSRNGGLPILPPDE